MADTDTPFACPALCVLVTDRDTVSVKLTDWVPLTRKVGESVSVLDVELAVASMVAVGVMLREG